MKDDDLILIPRRVIGAACGALGRSDKKDCAALVDLRSYAFHEGQSAVRERLQKQCYDWGTYWRAPDSHGVELTSGQATELLEDALGVEVEIKSTPRPTCGRFRVDGVTDSFAATVAMAVHDSGYPIVAASVAREIINTARHMSTAQPSAKDGVRDGGDAFRENVARQWLESKASEECKSPPDGWHCTRGAGHVGPCASVPNEDLRSCTICGLTVDVSKGHVAPSSDFTMQGRTKPKATTAAGLVDEAMVIRACNAYDRASEKDGTDPALYPAMHAALEAAIGREVGK